MPGAPFVASLLPVSVGHLYPEECLPDPCQEDMLLMEVDNPHCLEFKGSQGPQERQVPDVNCKTDGCGEVYDIQTQTIHGTGRHMPYIDHSNYPNVGVNIINI